MLLKKGSTGEDVKNDTVQVKTMSNSKRVEIKTNGEVGLYVITFNSPKQFETLINSFNSAISFSKSLIF